MTSKKAFTRNTSGLLEHARKKAQESSERVTSTIDRMFKGGHAVNFTAVAKAAGVTKGYLYTQGDLRARIEALRRQQAQGLKLMTDGHQEKPRTEKSKEIVLQAKEKRIRELEAENARLKAQLQTALGKQYADI